MSKHNQAIIHKNKASEAGFSVVTTIMMIMFAGVFIGISAPIVYKLMPPSTIAKSMADNEEKIQDIKIAMSNFVEREGFMPCPAEVTAAPDSAAFGRATNCANAVVGGILETDTGRDSRLVRIGALPFRDLDIPERFALDTYGNVIRYAVTHALTDAVTFDNTEGGIFVIDDVGNHETGVPGRALYIVYSGGPSGGFQGCDSTNLEGENCNNDATFRVANLGMNPDTAAFYDDILFFSEQEPQTLAGVCGIRGMTYSPANPNSDPNGCLDITKYAKFQSVRYVNTETVTCTVSNSFCDGNWITLLNMQDGDYILEYEAYVRFDHAQPSQYALLEFEVAGEVQATQRIPFEGTVCQAQGPVQYVKGMVEKKVEDTNDMSVRIRMFGGDNSPATNGCGGSTPEVSLIAQGDGNADARKSLSINAMRRFGSGDGTGGALVVGGGVASGSGGPAGEVEIASGNNVFIIDENGNRVDVDGKLPIVPGQTIMTTDTSGVVLITFADGAEVTLYGKSELEIEDYFYEAGSQENVFKVDMKKGIFTYFSGLMKGNDRTINHPKGSIGIRGTGLWVQIEDVVHNPDVEVVVLESDIFVYGGRDQQRTGLLSGTDFRESGHRQSDGSFDYFIFDADPTTPIEYTHQPVERLCDFYGRLATSYQQDRAKFLVAEKGVLHTVPGGGGGLVAIYNPDALIAAPIMIPPSQAPSCF
jgi:hypothetical protein